MAMSKPVATTLVLNRGVSDPSTAEGRDYSGVRFAFTFKSPNNIGIEAVTFFGPHRKSPQIAEYIVEVDVAESYVNGRRGKMQQFMSFQQWKVTAVQGEKFTIHFDKSVWVPKDIWVEVGFQLNGPPTEFLSHLYMFEGEHDVDGIVIDTAVRGSAQLKEMAFHVIE